MPHHHLHQGALSWVIMKHIPLLLSTQHNSLKRKSGHSLVFHPFRVIMFVIEKGPLVISLHQNVKDVDKLSCFTTMWCWHTLDMSFYKQLSLSLSLFHSLTLFLSLSLSLGTYVHCNCLILPAYPRQTNSTLSEESTIDSKTYDVPVRVLEPCTSSWKGRLACHS